MKKQVKIILKKSYSKTNLKRKGLKYKWSYTKISSSLDGKKVNEKVRSMLSNDINILVFNFVDMLSHARTEISMIRDLANDEPAYRSLTRSWFMHSSLFELLKTLWHLTSCQDNLQHRSRYNTSTESDKNNW
jgi:hypothetical protein